MSRTSRPLSFSLILLFTFAAPFARAAEDAGKVKALEAQVAKLTQERDALKAELDALKLDAEYIHTDIGWEFWCREGNALPDRSIKTLRSTTCGLFGAITSKPQDEAKEELIPELKGKGLVYFSPIVKLRQMFNLHTNMRPCKTYEGNPLNFRGTAIANPAGPDGTVKDVLIDQVVGSRKLLADALIERLPDKDANNDRRSLQLAPDTQLALDNALIEASKDGHRRAGTQHLLLAVLDVLPVALAAACAQIGLTAKATRTVYERMRE